MVASIRHWAIAAGVFTEDDRLRPTEFGHLLLADDGLDPWMEDPSSTWLMHWHIAGRARLTTWYWAFSHYSALTFDRETLARGLSDMASRRGWARAADSTIRRDVGCLVRAYAPPLATTSALFDDAFESPLAELDVLRATGRRDGFRFMRGPKSTLHPGVLAYAITRFWQYYAPGASTLSFEALAYEPGSPGRVFVLGEDDLASLLAEVEDLTHGAYRWSETAGLRQLIRAQPVTADEALGHVRACYPAAAS